MGFLKYTVLVGALVSSSVFADVSNKKNEHRALPGTNTIVISISIDENGYPQPSLLDEIILRPGQKIVFAGPDEFTISFKEI